MSAAETAARGLPAQLVRAPPESAGERDWDGDARRLLDAERGFTRLLGTAGTGKTSLLTDLAARRMAESAAGPRSVLLLTSSRSAAESLRRAITDELTGRLDHAVGTVREPLVRTVHSYAFAVLRLRAERRGLPAPRLLSNPEQDVVVRELLDGDIDLGAPDWPERLRGALNVPGFAEQLRDLISRAAERGLAPEDLEELGEREQRHEWLAAGKFWRQYEEVTALHSGGGHALAMPGAEAFDAAELVSSALLAFTEEPELLAGERARVRHLLVDDAQHLDPLQYRLISELGEGAADFVLAGDPDQSVFAFRGADPALLDDADPSGAHTVTLQGVHRARPNLHTAVQGLTHALPRPGRRRAAASVREGSGSVRTRLFPTPAAEASWIADQLRRAHLADGVPWSRMAVLMRSPSRGMTVLHRALRGAGVPVGEYGEELPLAHRPAVRPLLTLLDAAVNPQDLDVDDADSLLSSSLGGADPLTLRRLRRGLRRIESAAGGERGSDELLLQALREGDVLTGLGEAEGAALRRVVRLLNTAREAVDSGASVERVLWRVWQESGLEQTLLRRAGRGGSLGEKADRDLDAIVALFDAAGRYVDRLPRASVAAFTEYLGAQHIAGDSLAPAAAPAEGVALLSAHAAAGREWTLVVVPGVQEGTWPDLRPRGSVLGVERLVDVLSGVDDSTASATAPLLAEERRLFYLAASRARERLLVSAVSGEDEQPSRFLEELDTAGDSHGSSESGSDTRPEAEPQRALGLAELVGQLRRVVCDPRAEPRRRKRAARQLARLADAGVRGAHPDSWHGLPDVSTRQPLREQGAPIDVSPSTVDVLARCPLRWLLERHGGSDPAQLSAVTGTLVHTLAQAAADGADDEQLRAALDEAWSRVDAGAPWFSRRERKRVQRMVDNFVAWLNLSRAELTQLGTEQDFAVSLPAPDDAETADDAEVRLRGRVDRVELDEQNRPVIVDLKTAKSPASAAQAQENPQLAAYQLAALIGAFTETGERPGGARLVYVAKSHHKQGATEREQPGFDEDNEQQWLELVRSAARDSRGPEYRARENPDCARCPARTACPLRPEGRQVTG